mgnify:CR=1 FL=1
MDRDEFRSNLWLLTRAPDAEVCKPHLSFSQLDLNGSAVFIHSSTFPCLTQFFARVDTCQMCDLSFSKLDLNGSGSLERDDLTNAMRRQLELARNLVPK